MSCGCRIFLKGNHESQASLATLLVDIPDTMIKRCKCVRALVMLLVSSGISVDTDYVDGKFRALAFNPVSHCPGTQSSDIVIKGEDQGTRKPALILPR
jgi:hypothetical protein